VDIPGNLDMLIAGTSCVDFSHLNTNKKGLGAKTHEDLDERSKKLIKAFMNKAELAAKAQNAPVPKSQMSDDFKRWLRIIWSMISIEGESTRTFMAMLGYCIRFRPKIIILENVSSAPWDAMTKFWLPEIGYAATNVKVDSKSYLIPQTRNRGYLVAYDFHVYHADAIKCATLWPDLMKDMASKDNHLPLENFLLQRSDPRLHEARYLEERALDRLIKPSAAKQCVMRHETERMEHALPAESHPYTKLDSRSNVTPRDDCWRLYVRSKGLRVQDLLDINYLKKIKTLDIDVAHKHQIIDLSQNVDRITGHWLAGVAPCLLPRGMQFLTWMGRPVVGLEYLSLQGIPIDRIETSAETPAQLKDLGGNAMTVTVVGSAILAALMAERRARERGGGASGQNQVHGIAQVADERTFEKIYGQAVARSLERCPAEIRIPGFATAPAAFDLPNFHIYLSHQSLHSLGRQLCPCNNTTKRSRTSNLYQCMVCRQVRCADCKGNPAHRYAKMNLSNHLAGLLPDRAGQDLFTLPPGVIFNHLCLEPGQVDLFCRAMFPKMLIPFPAGHEHWQYHQVLAVLVGRPFYFDHTHVHQDITVSYKAIGFVMKAIITEYGLTWYISVLDGSNEKHWFSTHPLHSHIKNLGEPILRNIIQRYDFDQYAPRVSRWKIRGKPQGFRMAWEIIGGNKLRFSLACPRDSLDSRLHYVLDGVEGNYDYSPDCNTSHGRLFSRLQEYDGEYELLSPDTFMFHFRDPGSTTDAGGDHWVFSRSNRQLESGEKRDVLCRLSLHKPLTKATPKAHAKVLPRDPAYMRQFPSELPTKDQDPEEGDNDQSGTVDCCVDGPWEYVEGMGMNAWEQSIVALVPPSRTKTSEPDTRLPYVMLNPGIKLMYEDKKNGYKCKDLDFFACLELPVPDLPFPKKDFYANSWDISKYNGINVKLIPIGTSTVPMIPVRPEDLLDLSETIRFGTNHFITLDESYPTAFVKEELVDVCNECAPAIPTVYRHRDENGKVQDIFHATNDILAFRAAMDQRPQLFDAWVQYIPDHNSDVNPVLKVALMINTRRLAHSALRYLPSPEQSLQGQIKPYADVTVKFDLSFQSFGRSLRNLEPFTQSVLRTDGMLGEYTPTSFIQNQQKLMHDQPAAVEWMVCREMQMGQEGLTFTEQEVEEYVLAKNGMRAKATAEVPNLRYGGIVAHDVGYGKTVISLALIDIQRRRQRHSIRQQLFSRTTINLKATLIIVPRHIVRQWQHEIERFLQNDTDPWVVHTIYDLDDVEQEKMIQADIILLSRDVLKLTLERIEKLADASGCVITSTETGGRNLHDWYREVVQGLRKFRGMWTDTSDAQSIMECMKSTRNATINTMKDVIARLQPNSRRKPTKGTKKTATKTTFPASYNNLALSKAQRELQSGRLLELYSFDRMIYDEFSYDHPEVAEFFSSAVADSKWLLSGTPSLVDLEKVCKIGDLLNVHVARVEQAIPKSAPPITDGPSYDMTTGLENIEAYRAIKSENFVYERHQVGLRFLKHFARQNLSQPGSFTIKEWLVPSRMITLEAVLYNQVTQALRDANWDVDAVTGAMGNAVERLVHAAVSGKVKYQEKLARSVDVLIKQSSGSIEPFLNIIIKESHRLLQHQHGGTVSFHKAISYLILVCEDDESDIEARLRGMWHRLIFLMDNVRKDPLSNHDRAVSTMKLVKNLFRKLQTSANSSFVHGDENLRLLRDGECGSVDQDEGMGNIICNCVDRAGTTEDNDDLAAAHEICKENGGEAHQFNAWDWFVIDSLPPNAHHVWTAAKTEEDLHSLHNQTSRQELFKAAQKLGLKVPTVPSQVINVLMKDLGLLTSNRNDTISKVSPEDKDFKFGITLSTEFPRPNKLVTVRGGKIPECVEQLSQTLLSFQEGLKQWVSTQERLRFLRQIKAIVSGRSRTCRNCKRLAKNHFELDDSQCDGVICSDCSGEGPGPRKDRCKAQEFQCNACNAVKDNLEDIHLFVTCGHLLCTNCASTFEKQGAPFRCPADNCMKENTNALVPVTMLTEDGRPTGFNPDSTSSKINGVLSLVTEIQGKNNEDKIVIFVQQTALKDGIYKWLRHHDVKVVRFTKQNDRAKILESFKRPEHASRVLILSMMDEEAAGSNLTVANHVIFVSPLATDRVQYNMVTRQARGRCVRPGQQAEVVHIYHMVTVHTVEADILEARLGRELRVPLVDGERQLMTAWSANEPHLNPFGDVIGEPN
jgi:SNF2 family DNA or RNA helicase/site-specific DNA-cytosine methylase